MSDYEIMEASPIEWGLIYNINDESHCIRTWLKNSFYKKPTLKHPLVLQAIENHKEALNIFHGLKMNNTFIDFDCDIYSEFVTTDKNIVLITENIRANKSVIIGWTDGRSTHYDILFTARPIKFGLIQGGIKPRGYLFVSIVSLGCFGFEISQNNQVSHQYISEKLSQDYISEVTAEKLAVLVNAVLKILSQEMDDGV